MPDSLKKRYLYKLGANISNALLGFVTMLIVPRSLGPSAYGDFTYLTTVFSQVVNFFSFGTPYGFFTKLSQRQKEQKLIRFYIYFLALVVFLVLVAYLVLVVFDLKRIFLPGQKDLYITFALIFSLLFFFTQIVRQTNDAFGYTRQSEIFFSVQKGLSIIIILSLYLLGYLNLFTFFIHHFFILVFIISMWSIYLKRKGLSAFSIDNRLTRKEVMLYLSEFYRYSHPIFIYSLIGLITIVGERWLLQTFGGSEQQGFFGLSYKISAVVFLFTGAMTPLFTREFSIAWDQKDFIRMKILFLQLVPLFFVIASFISLFIAVNGTEFSLLLGGEEYRKAGLALSLMALYPIHQTYGQLAGSIFYATGKTKEYRNIGMVIMPVGLILAFVLLGPKKYGGLDLGSVGLAIKMIVLQFIEVNIFLFYGTKLIRISYFLLLKHQIFVIVSFLFLSFTIKQFTLLFFHSILLRLITGGAIYSLIIFILVYRYPKIVFWDKKEMNKYSSIINVFKKSR